MSISRYGIQLFRSDGYSQEIKFILKTSCDNQSFWLRIIHAMIVYEISRRCFNNNLLALLNLFDIYCNKDDGQNTEICNVVCADECKIKSMTHHKFSTTKTRNLSLSEIITKKVLSPNKSIYYWEVGNLKKLIGVKMVTFVSDQNVNFIQIECQNEFTLSISLSTWQDTFDFINDTIKSASVSNDGG